MSRSRRRTHAFARPWSRTRCTRSAGWPCAKSWPCREPWPCRTRSKARTPWGATRSTRSATRSTREGTRRMHRASRSRGHRRTHARRTRRTAAGRTTTRSTWPRSIKNRPAPLRSRRRYSRSRIDRPRSGLRHNHTPDRRWCRRRGRLDDWFRRFYYGRSSLDRLGLWYGGRRRSRRCQYGRRERRRCLRRTDGWLGARSASARSNRNTGSRFRRHDDRTRNDDRGTPDTDTLRRTAGDRRRWRHNARALVGQRHNAARGSHCWCRSSRGHGGLRWCGSGSRGRVANRRGRWRCHYGRSARGPRARVGHHWRTHGTRWRGRRRHGRARGCLAYGSRSHYACRTWRIGCWCSGNRLRPGRGCIPCHRLRLLAFQDRLCRVTWLRSLRKIKLRTSLDLRPVRATRADGAAEIAAHLLGLILFDGTGVGLAANAQRLQCIQNRPALYFKFPCKIINANFAHPSLFISPCGASCSYQPRCKKDVYRSRYYR